MGEIVLTVIGEAVGLLAINNGAPDRAIVGERPGSPAEVAKRGEYFARLEVEYDETCEEKVLDAGEQGFRLLLH